MRQRMHLHVAANAQSFTMLRDQWRVIFEPVFLERRTAKTRQAMQTKGELDHLLESPPIRLRRWAVRAAGQAYGRLEQFASAATRFHSRFFADLRSCIPLARGAP